MKEIIKKNTYILKKSGKILFLFEFMFKSVLGAVFYPLFLLCFNISLKSAGIKYLTNGYITRFFFNPITIIFIVLFCVIFACITIYEKCCLSILINISNQGKKISVYKLFLEGIALMKKRIRKRNVTILFYEVLLFPFLNVIGLALLVSNLSLPEFLTSVFGNRTKLYICLLLLFVFFFFIAIRFLFIQNYLIFLADDIKSASKKSAELVNGNIFKVFFIICFWNIIIALNVILVFSAISLLIIVGVFLLDAVKIGIAMYLTVIKTVKIVIIIGLVLISVPMSYTITTGMFLQLYEDKYHPVHENQPAVSMGAMVQKKGYIFNKKNHLKIVITFLTIISSLLIVFYVLYAVVVNPFDRVQLLQVPDITAHRGSSIIAPENTISAFKQAVDDMADYAELDVHLTRDGKVVVIHDVSLKRTTGLKENVFDITYNTIQDLDAGSWFGEQFVNERIPTLEDVLLVVGNDIKLNIEIKYNKNEGELTEKVVELIEEYDFVNNCVVTSSDYMILKQVKSLNEDIRTGYVISAAYGGYYNMSDVDIISINQNLVNKSVIDAIHNNGKEIYVWTVNNPSRMKSLADMGVDNIITDDPVRAREVVYSRYTIREISYILEYVFNHHKY